MIKITSEENNNIIEAITIKGHANNDISGKDIICASVSSIVITTVNAIIRFDKEAIFYEEKAGFMKINNLKKDDKTNTLLTNMLDLLRELVSKYPKNIQMKRGK